MRKDQIDSDFVVACPKNPKDPHRRLSSRERGRKDDVYLEFVSHLLLWLTVAEALYRWALGLTTPDGRSQTAQDLESRLRCHRAH